MKIAWFTPFAAGSMVARFSAIVTRELSRHADVDIWHPPAPELQPTALRTIAMPRRMHVSPAMLEAYDFAVYNLGEEDDGQIAAAACAAPGIAILHGTVEASVRRAYAVVVHSEAAREFAARLSFLPVTVMEVAQERSARQYAGLLLALAEKMLRVAPVLYCVDTASGRLAEMGVEAPAATVDRVASEAYALFGGVPSATTGCRKP